MESQVLRGEIMWQTLYATKQISGDQNGLAKRLRQRFEASGGVHHIAEVSDLMPLKANFSRDHTTAMQDSAKLGHLTEPLLPHGRLGFDRGGEVEDATKACGVAYPRCMGQVTSAISPI